MVAPILFEGQIILGPTSKSRSSCFRALVVLFASVVALFALADAGAGEAAEPTTVFGASERCAPSRVRFLALEGGGVNRIAYAGVIGALEDAGVLQEVVGFSGSSAGSIIASFLAAGYSVSLERSESEALQTMHCSKGPQSFGAPTDLDHLQIIVQGETHQSSDRQISIQGEFLQSQGRLGGWIHRERPPG